MPQLSENKAMKLLTTSFFTLVLMGFARGCAGEVYDTAQENLFIEIEYEGSAVFIDKPFQLNVRLYYTLDDINNPEFSDLDIQMASVLLQSTVQYEVYRNGIHYGVYDKEYQITPLTNESIQWPDITFRGEIITGLMPVKLIRAFREGFEIEVRPN